MPRTKKIQDTTLLKMILDVIIEKGATTFSLEDLTQKTGLSPATLLQRKKKKKNILLKAIELANQDLKSSLTDRVVKRTACLQEIIDIYMEFSAPFSNPLAVANGLDILKLDITEKSLNKLTRRYFEIRRDKISSLVALAQERGEISSNLDINQVTWNLECLWQGSIMQWALVGKGSLQGWIKERFATYLTQAL